MSKPKLILTRHRLVAMLAAWLAAAAALTAGSSTAVVEPLFEPRVVDVKVEGVSLERVDVSMQIAVRASRNVTIRTLTFSDGYIDKIPVWVAPVEGRWPLRKGEEFVIPPRVQVTLQARDALATGGLASLLGRDAVDARATVEMSFDTPWMARMLRTATDVAITEVAFKAPVPASSPLMQPLARLGAGVIEFLQRQAGPLLANGPGGQAATRDVIDRFGPSVATVETEYRDRGRPRAGSPHDQDARAVVDPVDLLHHARGVRAVALRRRRCVTTADPGRTPARRVDACADHLGIGTSDRDQPRRTAPASAEGHESARLLAGDGRASPHAHERSHGAVGADLPASR